MDKEHKHYRPENETIRLYCYPGGGFYEVDVERITTAARLAGWIRQLIGKSWLTPQALWDFLWTVDEYRPLRSFK